jgi:nitroreductase
LSSAQKSDSQFDPISSPRDGYPRFGKGARQKLTEEETSQLLSLTALSLSAFNVHNCRFVVVRDQDLRKQINKFSDHPSQVPPNSSLIILCADLQHWERTSGSNGENDSHGPPETSTSRKKTSHRNNDHLHRDEAMCSCGIAAQTFMLTSRAMNYDSWRLEGFDYEGIGKLINLPPDYVVAILLVVGKNIKQLSHNAGQFNFNELVIMDQF